MRFLVAGLFLIISFFCWGQSESTQQLVDSIRNKSGYPGIVYSVVDSDGVSATFPSGWASVEEKVAMTKSHKLHGGSTGKTIVSALIMQLVQEGKLSVDDPVQKHLASYEWYDRLVNNETIKVKHLLQHSSGIIRYEFKEEFLSDLLKDPDRVWKPEDMIGYVLDDEPPFAAGEGFTYADTNYILLGMIIEKISGKSFYNLASEKVIQPLGLESITPTNTRVVENMAQGYYTEGSEYALGFKAPFLKDGRTQNNMQFEWTGGGYCFATSDYAKLLKSLYEGEVFDLEKVGDYLFDFIEAQEVGGEYGMGVMKYNFPGLGEFIGHAGFFPGYNSIGLYHTESKMAFAMQINSTDIEHLRPFFGDFLTITRAVLNGK